MHLAITRSYSRTFLRKHAATVRANCHRNTQTPAIATCWGHVTPATVLCAGRSFVPSRNYAGESGSGERGPSPPGGMHRMDMSGKQGISSSYFERLGLYPVF